MRQVVMLDDVREIELWPSKLFDKYLELTEKDVKELFNKKDLVEVSCPACGDKNKKKSFNKYGFAYNECCNCKTLYVSPRPNEEKIYKYYKESKAVDFWHSEIIKNTLKNRTIHQSIPRATWIANLVEEYFEKHDVFVSVNTISQSLLEEIKRLNLFTTKLLYKPLIKISDSFISDGGFQIINDEINQKNINANAASAFGVIDRVFSPKKFLESARSFLTKDGLFFITTSSISGFDLQVLWDKSKTIFPPDRMNLLSIEGLSILFEKNGFEIIELSTPGQLDVELVKNAIKNEKNINIPRFISYMIDNRDENSHHSFQEFLQHYKLSSHVRIAAKKIK